MITFRPLSNRFLVAKAVMFLCVILLVQGVNAQRPSVAEMQAQIDAITFPYDEPAAQVRTALDILPTFQEAVVRSYRASGEAPMDRSSAGLTTAATDTSTDFIVAVSVNNGTIIFTFGFDADSSLSGKTLAFTPYETSDRTVVWRCGNDPQPPSTNYLGTYSGGNSADFVASTIPATAHPNPCILQSFADDGAVVRAQIQTAFDILPVFQDAVVDHFRQTGAVPRDRIEAGLTPDAVDSRTNFIERVDIINGRIDIEFGNDAHADLIGRNLTFTPYETPDMTVVWRCGGIEPPPSGTQLLGTSSGGWVPLYQPGSVAFNLQPRPCITKVHGATEDVILAQVLESFDVVETIKDAIEAAGAELGTPGQPIAPATRIEAGLSANATDTVGRYFSSVEVSVGSITVTYDADETHALIRGDTMTWTPYESMDGTIVWRCGYSQQPANTEPMGWASGVNVATFAAPTLRPEYLPAGCRY